MRKFFILLLLGAVFIVGGCYGSNDNKGEGILKNPRLTIESILGPEDPGSSLICEAGYANWYVPDEGIDECTGSCPANYIRWNNPDNGRDECFAGCPAGYEPWYSMPTQRYECLPICGENRFRSNINVCGLL